MATGARATGRTTPPERPEDPGSRREVLTEPSTLNLVLFELSLETASIGCLERASESMSRARVEEWFEASRDVEEVALLATCHRVELVLTVGDPEEVRRWRDRLPGEPRSWTEWRGLEAVEHLFAVAGGRRALVTGEKEIRLQVRAAARSTFSRHPRRIVRELFEAAAATADELEPAVPPARSIAAVAARAVLERVGRPFPRIVVIGAGTIGRQLAEMLCDVARVTLVYRHRSPDERFLRATGARAVRVSELPEELRLADGVIAAAKSGERCLRVEDLPSGRPLVMVDLGVPRNLDPEVRGSPNVTLLDLEDLRALFPPSASDPKLDALRTERARRFYERFERLALESWIDSLRRASESVRRSEVERARAFLGPLSSEQEVAVERLTQRLVSRLLLPPTERLRSLPIGPDGERMRRFALDLLRPLSDEP